MLNQFTCGDSLKLIDELDDESIDSCVIDPPYGVGLDFEGDATLNDAKCLLGNFLQKLYPKLKQNGHLAVFFTMRNLDVCIEQVKQHFTYRRVLSMYIPKGAARPYLGWLPRTQAIVIGQKYVPGQPTDFHWDLSTHLKQKLDESGYSRSELARLLKCDSRLVMKWTRPGDWAWCLPTPRFYPQLKELLKLDDTYDFLLTRQATHREMRGDFPYKHDCYVVDDKNEKMLHPSQKPLEVVSHLVQCTTPQGGVVLDGFAGSGTTGIAARRTGRNFVCFEVSEEFCKIARERLANEL